MRTWIRLGVVSLVLLGCRRDRTDLHVVSRGPEGPQAEAAVQEVRVVFDKPMVAAAATHHESNEGPLTLEPAVPGKQLWPDPQTLLFRALAPLPRSTQFRASLPLDLRALDGARTPAPVRWSFTTQRLEVTDLLPAERRFLAPSERLTLRFSQPVAPPQVAARCLLTGPGAAIALRLADDEAEESAAARQSVMLVPVQPMARGTDYQLQCDAALSGAEGRVGMAAAYTTALHTYGDLAVTAARPTGGAVDSDDLNVEIEFSNPVQREDVRAHLVSKPRIPALDDGWLEGQDRRKYHVRVNLEPGTSYEIKVTAGMKDAFGQALAKDHVFFFTAGDAKPRLSMEEGTYVVEAQPGRYPLWTRNVGHLDVAAARVPEDRVVPLLERQRQNDDSEGGDDEGEAAGGRPAPGDGKAEGDKLPAQWRKLGLKVAQKRVLTSGVKNKWQDGALDLASLAGGERTGVFVARVEAKEAAAKGEDQRAKQVTANVTNLGLVAKTGQAGGLVWAVHLSDGKPAAGVKIAVRDRKNKVRFSGTTAADGTVSLPPASTFAEKRAAALRSDEPYEMENGAEDQIYVLAREGADVAVMSGSWRDGLYSWNFNVASRAPAGRARGFIQTDRGLYRPGELVHLRGLARALRLGEGLVLPKEKQIAVVIEDPRGDEVLKRTLPLTAFGGFSVDLALPGEARLGDWAVTATIGKGDGAETFRDHFSVEEYRPATFELQLKEQKKTYQLGDKVRVDLRASYLYGAPLGKGHVTFSVRRRDHLPHFARYEDFSFSDINAMEDLGYYWARQGERSYSYDTTDQEAELDKAGRATLRFPTADPDKEHKTAQDYLVEASVTDESSQSRSAQLAVIAHRSPFYLGLHTTEYVPEAGKPFVVNAIALDDEGKERAAEAELVVSLREWRCDYSQSAGGYYGSYQCKDKTTELERRKVQLTANGPSALSVTAKRAGTILISLRAPAGPKGKDGKGAGEVVASDQVWAVGKGEAFWRMSEGAKVPLQASKKRYRPGDTALLVAQAPLSGATALVTVEREGVISHRVQPFASSGEPFQVPITDKHAPNVYVSVVLVRGRTGEGEAGKPAFGMGLVDLEVDPSDKRLRVEVTSDKPTYRPGDTIKARVQVRSAAGAPVAAEVALAVADEGVLQLIGYKTPDPQAAFYAPFGLGVTTATNWNRLARRGDPNQDTDGEGGDSGASAGKVRDKFVSTAFWAPALVTGADGSAEVSFQAPDNLTAFRVMAVVADAGDRFGNAEGRFTVQKPLQAIPALPRFLTVGDHLQAGVVVHNRTPSGGAVTVTAAAEGATLGGERRREVQVPAGGEKLVLFDLRAPGKGGAAKLTFTAALGAESDAVAVTLPVLRPLEQDALLVGEGEAQPGAEVTLPVSLPKDAAEGALEVVLDPAGLSGIDEGLRYLIDYPYGCLEQTTSRVIPMVKVEDLARSLDLPGLRGPKLRGFVEAGVAKVLRHQHEDGAFSLWPGTGTEPFLTAYALYGLGQVKHAGYAVPEKSLSRGLDALKQGLGEKRGMGSSDNPLGEGGSRAFALYVLAELGQPDQAAMAKLAAERATLPVFGQALLARALRRGGGDKELGAGLVKDVLATVQPVPGVPGAARAVDGQQERLWWYYSSDVRTSALVLSMLLEVDPAHALVPQLVKGLLTSRRGGHWDNTQDNLFSLVALSDYARGKVRRAQKGGGVRVALGGKVLLEGKPGGKGAASAIRRVEVPLAQLKDGAPLTIAVTGEPLTYVARVRYGRSLEKAPAAASGFQLERKLLDDKGQPKGALRAGDLVRVVLTVRAGEARTRIALVDHLPAGLEPINPRLAVREEGGDDSSSSTGGTGGSRERWDAMEMRDDRVAVFADELEKDRERTLSYLARVTGAGTFLWPSATVEEMYRPDRRARTASGALEVRPR